MGLQEPVARSGEKVVRSATVPLLDSPPSVVYVESLDKGSTAVQSLLLGLVLLLLGGAFGLVGLVAVETLETCSQGCLPVEFHCVVITAPI